MWSARIAHLSTQHSGVQWTHNSLGILRCPRSFSVFSWKYLQCSSEIVSADRHNMHVYPLSWGFCAQSCFHMAGYYRTIRCLTRWCLQVREPHREQRPHLSLGESSCSPSRLDLSSGLQYLAPCRVPFLCSDCYCVFWVICLLASLQLLKESSQRVLLSRRCSSIGSWSGACSRTNAAALAYQHQRDASVAFWTCPFQSKSAASGPSVGYFQIQSSCLLQLFCSRIVIGSYHLSDFQAQTFAPSQVSKYWPTSPQSAHYQCYSRTLAPHTLALLQR